MLHGFTGSGADWEHAGRDVFERDHRLIIPDARGHGRTPNPSLELRHKQCARDTLALLDHLGLSRIEAIGLSLGGNTLLHMATKRPVLIESVVVSATMSFPEQARAIMRERGLQFPEGDMSFTADALSQIRAHTLIVSGDRDFLYPVEMGVEMYRAIPDAALWIVSNGSHVPIFGADERAEFVRISRAFLGSATPRAAGGRS